MTALRRVLAVLALSLIPVLAACGSGEEPSVEAGRSADDGRGRQVYPTPEVAASAVLEAWAEGGVAAAAAISDVDASETPRPPSDTPAVLRFCVAPDDVPTDVDAPDVGPAERICVAVAPANRTVYVGVRRADSQWVATSLAV